jgi:uncharacterized membrane protein YgaE (UPF0421/DUF939 family)
MTVRVTRKDLFLTAFSMLPAFMIGEWLASLCGFRVFSAHDVFEGFWGALILAAVLAFTRGGDA